MACRCHDVTVFGHRCVPPAWPPPPARFCPCPACTPRVLSLGTIVTTVTSDQAWRAVARLAARRQQWPPTGT